jgi:hypothetical protein
MFSGMKYPSIFNLAEMSSHSSGVNTVLNQGCCHQHLWFKAEELG